MDDPTGQKTSFETRESLSWEDQYEIWWLDQSPVQYYCISSNLAVLENVHLLHDVLAHRIVQSR